MTWYYNIVVLSRLRWVTTTMFLTSSLFLLFSSIAYAQPEALQVIDGVSHAADIAREKDVVWLALVTCIVSMLFSAWLVHQMMKMQREQNAAMRDHAKELSALRNEWEKRPCAKK